MAGQKYGNTLISSRKDETLTYAQYVKNLSTGKSVQTELEELRQLASAASVKSVALNALDSMSDKGYYRSGAQCVYAVTQNSINIGILMTYTDEMGHVAVQILQTQKIWNPKTGTFDSHRDGVQHTYVRLYNYGAPHLEQEVGTWSEWTAYVDSSVEERISALEKQMDGISAITEGEIEDVWINE